MEHHTIHLFTLALFTLASVAYGADFSSSVYPVLRKAGCAGCHNPDGVASGTRLKFPEADANAAVIEAFGRSAGMLVDRTNPARSLLLTKPTQRVPHAGGKRIEPGSPDETVLRSWIESLVQAPTAASAEVAENHKPVGPVLRRLTHGQYNRTVRDLLGDDSRIADQFPPEDFVNGFRNQYQSQNTSPLLAEAYTNAAEKLAKKAFSGPDLSRIVPCKTADPGCRLQFLKTFGRKTFRRPLTAGEVDRYSKLFASAYNERNQFTDGARMVVEAMLQSPNFLLRAEDGLDPAQRPYEIASRLSYFLWNSMPDESLFKQAESGQLSTPEGIERSARRMLKDPRSKLALHEFLSEWLRFDRVLNTVKDRRQYPQFTLELAVAMTEETKRLFSELVWNNGNFMEFYSADYSFLSSDLAALYGVKAGAAEYTRVQLPASSERSGILGHATFLALTSKPAETSPTARGLFVREQFLCQEVPQPPPGVSTNLPALTKEKPRTNRERLAIHLNSEACASCHNLVDPIGFGFERFDAVGQRREKQKIVFRSTKDNEDQSSSVDLNVDTRGFVAGIPDSAFTTPRELGRILAASAQCQECVVKQLFRYAAGRHETAADRVVIRKAFEDFKRSGFRFQELMVALSKWIAYPPGRTNGIRTD